MTMDHFRELATKKLGVKVNMTRPYKCCDLKPMYGLIFEDDIFNYDFWGECDFDLIWGDLSSFFDKYNLSSYDKFSPLGHLSLYRNTREINRSFMLDGDKCGGWKYVAQTDESFAFDEISGICEIFQKHNLSFFKKKLFADITPVYHRYKLSEYCFLDDDMQINYDYQVFYWEEGKVYRAYLKPNNAIVKEELMYIHFRSRPNFTVSEDLYGCSSFYITNVGFYPKNSEVTKEHIQKYNHFKSSLSEIIELISYKMLSWKKRVNRKFRHA